MHFFSLNLPIILAIGYWLLVIGYWLSLCGFAATHAFTLYTLRSTLYTLPLLMMIRLAAEDGHGAIDLLDEEKTHHLV